MLDDIYKMYCELAENVPDWRTANKNDLINTYCDLEDQNSYKSQYYLAAIMCRYWPKIQRFYKDTPMGCSYEDVYDWLTESVLAAVKGRAWRDPTNGLYQDPAGPDKVINRVMKTVRINYLVHINRLKRKTNLGAASIEELQDLAGDAVDYDEDVSLVMGCKDFDELEYSSTVQYLYSKKLYFLLFVYDIIYEDSCSNQEGKFSENAVVKNLKSIDNDYLLLLAEKTDIPYRDILFAFSTSIAGRSPEYLHEGVKQALIKLRQLYYEGVV